MRKAPQILLAGFTLMTAAWLGLAIASVWVNFLLQGSGYWMVELNPGRLMILYGSVRHAWQFDFGAHAVRFECWIWPGLQQEHGGGWTAIVPLWTIAISLLGGNIYWIVRWWRRRKRGPGRCAKCGYDLRGTPEQCPECGRNAS